jgi:sugar-specific transcriptional regulator TrmB
MDEAILENLERLGFSQMEARVYCELVTGGEQSGYQIARALNATRSSVYPALDALYRKGAVLLLPGEINIYQSISPESVIRRLKNGFMEQADAAIESFAAVERGPLGERYANVAGKSNLVARAIDLIDGSGTEIVMNLSLDFSLFADSLRAAAARGVRIILFSWTEHDTLDVPLEFYCPRDGNAVCLEERILIVTDATRCLIGSNDRSALIPHRPLPGPKKLPAGENDFLGMASDNRLMVNIILEHIHLDIYLLKLRAKYGQDLVDSSIQLGSLMEKGVL